MAKPEEHVVADIWRRIGDEHTREVGEWLHKVAEERSLALSDGKTILPSVAWLASAVSGYISAMALEKEFMGDENDKDD